MTDPKQLPLLEPLGKDDPPEWVQECERADQAHEYIVKGDWLFAKRSKNTMWPECLNSQDSRETHMSSANQPVRESHYTRVSQGRCENQG